MDNSTADDGRPDKSVPGSDATSKETLKDLEENQGNIESGNSNPEPEPSPDGAFDESDEIKDAGPM